ncbi:zinc finger protein 64 isoform X2 [Myotis yumanensis]|uniref:zinc finger protein 64 isoform X2 n=1 Tax=Myotis yumanensis TaxID=159337 RepID=UPI0038D04ECA
MNATSEGESFPGSVQIPGGTTVLVELTPDIHICGICKQQFNNLDAFVAHKQSGCQLTSTTGAAPSTVQFVSEETVPATQTQTTTRTITSETQTITVSAPEFVFEHGYQTYLPTESSENQTATVISLPAKSRAKKPSAPPAQKRLNCCYPGCQFKTAYGMKDMERHLKIHTGDKPHKCEVCGKCFSRKDKLKTHMRCHTGVKPYKCKTCDYAAADSSSLNKHLRIHSDERPFKCQICPYASRNSSQLTVHLRSHTASELDNDAPKPTCPSSDSSDTQKAPVVAPPSESKQQTATLGERTFNCCYPGCHFKTVHGMKDLDRHLRIHTVILQNFVFSTMDLKKVCVKDSAEKKKRMMCIELKKEIIEKHDQGVRVIDLAKQYERSTSTICTILKQKESIQAITPAKGVKIISKQRTSIHENMEKLLMVWLTEKQLAGDTVTKAIICEKARAIYADLLQRTPGTSMDEASGEPFKASRGWFENFKKRTGIHSVVRHGEAAIADIKEGDINELIEEHSEELTTQELKELQTQQHMEVLQEIDDTEEEVISISEIKEMLGMWEKLSDFIQKRHPEKIATGRAMELFNDTCLTHFRNILKGRMKQISLDRFLSKTAVDESVAKRAKISK